MLKIDATWTLFLDRDGVINERIPGQYVRYWNEFHFCKGSLEAIVACSSLFGKIVVVTNQQGIGKGIMTQAELDAVHEQMLEAVRTAGGHIDRAYACPELALHDPACRKPNTGMGLQAQQDFPNIDFKKSIMVGDSISDIEFGQRLGMTTVLIEGKIEEQTESQLMEVDFRVDSLGTFGEALLAAKNE